MRSALFYIMLVLYSIVVVSCPLGLDANVPYIAGEGEYVEGFLEGVCYNARIQYSLKNLSNKTITKIEFRFTLTNDTDIFTSEEFDDTRSYTYTGECLVNIPSGKEGIVAYCLDDILYNESSGDVLVQLESIDKIYYDDGTVWALF